VLAPIALEQEPQKELEKGEHQTHKSRNVPGDADSLTFASGSCEELFEVPQENIHKVLTGQNITTCPASFAAACSLLEGNALATFDNTATVSG
jgi:hypothetical protein